MYERLLMIINGRFCLSTIRAAHVHCHCFWSWCCWWYCCTCITVGRSTATAATAATTVASFARPDDIRRILIYYSPHPSHSPPRPPVAISSSLPRLSFCYIRYYTYIFIRIYTYIFYTRRGGDGWSSVMPRHVAAAVYYPGTDSSRPFRRKENKTWRRWR